MTPKQTDAYIDQSVTATLAELETDAQHGLSSKQAQARIDQLGYNEIMTHEVSMLARIAKRFWGPIPWMIEIAAILSAIVGKWEDFFIIVTLLLINALLDFLQEHRALNALKALKKELVTKVRVKRDGKFSLIATRELVPGDIIRLRGGDLVPADVQLLDGDYLSIDESTLTGESLPVNKKATAVAYANTVVRQGEMHAVVVNTATHTRFSSVVSLVEMATLKSRSHFQRMVMQIGQFLILLSIAMVTLIVLIGLFRQEPFMELARFSMILMVAAIPVALPAVLSVTMAVGAMNLARRKAIVTRLTAIEELAGVDIFCSDKTGTLTQNQMQVAKPICFAGQAEAELIRCAVLASRRENDDPIELPLFAYAEQHFADNDWHHWQQRSFKPFDPVTKHTRAEIQHGDQQQTVFKGAPQVIMEMATLTDNEIVDLNKTIDSLAEKGYRTLAVARQDKGVDDIQLLGLIPLIDPPREDSAEVIAAMREFGVEVKMITGDNLAIAREIGEMLGLKKHAVRAKQVTGKSGQEIRELAAALAQAIFKKLNPEVSHRQAKKFADEVMTDLSALYDTSLLEREFIHTHESALVEMLESVDIFAEVLPEDKFTVVDTLQKADHIVGMTGDGVNDAPALRRADCGFAVANASDAARAAADIVLTAPGLSVISHAIEQSRFTFERMKSYATFRIAETIRIILFITLSIIAFEFYPITAIMIILLALLNDLPILTIAYDNTGRDDKPVRWQFRELFAIAGMLGIAGVTSSFVLYLILREQQLDSATIQSLLFLKLLIAGHSTLFVTRAKGWFWQKPWPSPMLLSAVFVTELIGTLIAVNGVFIASISWQQAGLIWLYALIWFIFNNAAKIGLQHMLATQREA